MLFFTKIGKYTEEEFETAYAHFKANNKPLLFTYFKEGEISTGNTNQLEPTTLQTFQKKINILGHYYTRYKNAEELKFKFNQQLEKLAASGFIEFEQPLNTKEKNVVKKNIERVKKIHIGDIGQSSEQSYNKKNIVEGDIKDVDQFRLGDSR